MSKNMAILENGIVINVIVVEDNQPESDNEIIYTEENPAHIGGHYVEGFFYSPQPYPSWTRDKGNWESPVPYPNDDNQYQWNEETESWDLVEVSE